MNKNKTMKDIEKIFTVKLRRLMKIGAVQGMMALMVCGVSMAHSNYAQLLDKEVTIRLNGVSFEKALKELETIGGVKFVYSADQLRAEGEVTLEGNAKTLRDVLHDLFAPRGIQYKVHEKEASITLKKQAEAKEKDQSMLDDDKNGNRYGPVMQITGTVTDATTQQPMAGVNIVVKGTTNGTTTDAEGKYGINADGGNTLVFSFIGYTSVEMKVGVQSIMDVSLQVDVKSLDEVVVNAGYWDVKEKEQTGSISRIAYEVIEKQPISNPLQALQGRMTGVYIQQNTGMPGGGLTIQVRGQNSLRNGIGGTINGNLPLYLVDGIPFTSTSMTSTSISNSNLLGGNPLSSINPADIESIEVLKDADATAIYGSRGANGVVLITTKKAKAGKTRIDLNVYRGAGKVANSINLLNTGQYLEMRKEALKNDGYSSLLQDPQYDIYWPDLKVWDSTRNTDWRKQLIGGTTDVTNAQLSVSGGNPNTQFVFGGGYYRETIAFPGTNAFQRGSSRFNLNHVSEDKRFRINVSTNYTSSVSNIPGSDLTSLAVTLAPNAPALYNSNGELNWENGTWTNPLAFLRRKYKNNIDNLVANALLNYEVLPGLNMKTTLGYTSMWVKESRLNPLSAYNPADLVGRTGSSNFGESGIKTWIVEPQISYARKLWKGNFNALVGSTFQESVQSGESIEATGYTNDALLENIHAATGINISGATYSQYCYAALFSRINYNWQEKYIINLTGRRDGSSRFGPGKQFANFGAVGAAWLFSNESFVSSNLSFLSFGKLRASYGATGSDAIGNYQYLNTYSSTTYPYNGTGGLMMTRLNNPNYSWETNKKMEGGLDLGFFKDRISASIAYYMNRSSNQLVGLPLPLMTGQSNVQFNLPATVQNRGLEFQITSSNVKTEWFQWTTNFNITIPDNKLIAFPDIEKFPTYANRFDVEKSLFIYKSLQYVKVDPQTGLYTFKDINQDGNVSSYLDLVGLKKITQQYYGGLYNGFKFHGIQLDLFLQFVKQTGYSYLRSFSFPGDFSNQPAIVMNRWRQPGDESSIQRFTAFDPDGTVTTAYSYNAFSNNAVTDASFIRLKNVSLSWQLPSKWTQKAKLEKSRVYVQGQNLLIFTKYLGLDPENQTSQSLPPLRIITVGLQITL
jgi:TonB-linked SusC/RagA family outer membrane protein